jgi:signal recognition particle receptor subunit beta
MAHLNVKDRVIEAKIVYYGAGLSGKTTNLEQVKKRSTDGKCGEMMTLNTDGDRTLFFDWLPFNVGKVNGCEVKVQLFTVPGQAQYAETRKKVLAGADGVVLVLDSQSGALDKNRQIVADLLDHLGSNKLRLDDLALVVQLNKRDLPTAMDCKELLEAVGMGERPFIEAVASSGTGVFETLREMTRLVLQSVKASAREGTPGLVTGGGASGLDGNTLYKEIVGDTIAGASLPAPSLSAPPGTQPSLASASVVLPRSGANGSTPTRSMERPAVQANGVSGAAVPTESARAPAGAPAGPPPGSPAAAVAALTVQVNEMVAGQRMLARRFETFERSFERSVNQAVVGALADFERRLVQRVSEVIDSTVAARIASIEAKVDGHAAQTGKVATSVYSVTNALSALDKSVDKKLESVQKALGERVDKLSSSVSRVETLEGAISTALAATERKVTEALADKLAASDAAMGAHGSHLGQVDKNVQAMSEALRAMMDDAAASQQKKSWWR